jgi:major membrane immunogen (membrane-anchored lipoprotein)
MKKAIYLCLMVAVMPFMSCSSDDDSIETPNPIVNTWFLIESKTITDGEESSNWLSACDKQDEWVIKTGGTITSTYHYKDGEGNCSVDDQETIEWVVTSSNNYNFTYVEDGNYITNVELDGDRLIETYSYSENGKNIEDIYIYSLTADESGDDPDPIIGKWSYTTSAETVDGETTYKTLSDCEKKSWVEFRVDGSGSSDFYDTNGTGECIGDDPILTFIWTSKGNNIYGVSANDEEEENIKITFDGNTMKISGTYMDGETEYSFIQTYIKSN